MNTLNIVRAVVNGNENYEDMLIKLYRSANKSGAKQKTEIAIEDACKEVQKEIDKLPLMDRGSVRSFFRSCSETPESNVLKSEYKKYRNSLAKDYYKTLGVRQEIAKRGLVKSDEIVPASKATKIDRAMIKLKGFFSKLWRDSGFSDYPFD